MRDFAGLFRGRLFRVLSEGACREYPDAERTRSGNGFRAFGPFHTIRGSASGANRAGNLHLHAKMERENSHKRSKMENAMTGSGTSVSRFEQLRHTDANGMEYWDARELAEALGYARYAGFVRVIDRAREACRNSGEEIEDHFAEYTTPSRSRFGKGRRLPSVRLSRYACYLIVLNGDPRKEVVALGQTYFAFQARLQEIEERRGEGESSEEERRLFLRDEMRYRNQELASAAWRIGAIRPEDYAAFEARGYMGLYGGLDGARLRERKGLRKGDRVLDYMDSTELAANLRRVTRTSRELEKGKARTLEEAERLHYEIGKAVRREIAELGGMMPEELPAAEESIRVIAQREKKVVK